MQEHLEEGGRTREEGAVTQADIEAAEAEMESEEPEAEEDLGAAARLAGAAKGRAEAVWPLWGTPRMLTHIAGGLAAAKAEEENSELEDVEIKPQMGQEPDGTAVLTSPAPAGKAALKGMTLLKTPITPAQLPMSKHGCPAGTTGAEPQGKKRKAVLGSSEEEEGISAF